MEGIRRRSCEVGGGFAIDFEGEKSKLPIFRLRIFNYLARPSRSVYRNRFRLAN